MTDLHKDDSRIDAIKEAGVEDVVYTPWDDEEVVRAIKDALSAA